MRIVILLIALTAGTAMAQNVSSEARRIASQKTTRADKPDEHLPALYANNASWRQATNEIARLQLQAKPLQTQLDEAETRIRLKRQAKQSTAADVATRDRLMAALRPISTSKAAWEVKKFDAEVAVKKQAEAARKTK